ncbi:inovirus Gp2 family protein [Shewanella xiamenensis]|uniref:inovirus Gp2 family protein n=1 Tax=Shewanella TaxID=22 RepID=UPI000031D56D|nr:MULTISPECIES: inovirus Gp2 family protein [Shewanella]MCT8857518.1 inovirus Gp2 family protein [Shewanella xiamenensis]MDH1627365.1 inovirus Gp2 family protein [Shewanella xiamenensis]MDV5248859.1 inovirus Gp2 family protein [Shewanella xiamenensis]PWH02694.1 inovirus Gp2 family protein [Shewanella xiamenensis]UWG66465.1 inovirus Gp2 family protein [Shewanella xiamenensis]
MFKNRNLNILLCNEYCGLPILRFKDGVYEQYLDKNYRVINQSLIMYSKVFAVRVDLRLSDEYESYDNRAVTRFIESLKAQVKADYIAKTKHSDGFVHKSDVLYIWVQETGEHNKPHYHLCLLFNGNAYRSLGKFELGRTNMYNRIVKAWASALAIKTINAQGLVHIPKHSCYFLDKTLPFTKTFELRVLFIRLSYFAKVDSKHYGDRRHHYGCSRTPDIKWRPFIILNLFC